VVRDDGVGGARTRGSGVLGLADRVAVLGGRLVVESPEGGGTLVAAEIPIPGG
jgi:signal transduction histidine kinase